MSFPSRRSFLATSASLTAAALTAPAFASSAAPAFQISLAQWSLHRTLRSGKMDNLDFAVRAKKDFGIEAVEYVNSFFKDKARDKSYLAEMNQRAADNGVTQLLIMIDGAGRLGHPDDEQRAKAVQNHHRWVEAAKELGCHSIRVNASSRGSYEEQIELAADGLRQLTEFGDQHGINVIVENHGGLSSNGAWLASVMKKVAHPRCGTRPDFGDSRLKGDDFDDDGNETRTDYRRMMKIVMDAGYTGWVGIEYEGSQLSEDEGIKATKTLLEKVRDELS